MQLDFNTVFLFLFVLLFLGLGTTNFIADKTNQSPKQTGRSFFALIFILMGAGLILYKMTNP
jgi:hypothetical protein